MRERERDCLCTGIAKGEIFAISLKYVLKHSSKILDITHTERENGQYKFIKGQYCR